MSTTQCLTGALLAIGLLEGPKGVNWLMYVPPLIIATAMTSLLSSLLLLWRPNLEQTFFIPSLTSTGRELVRGSRRGK